MIIEEALKKQKSIGVFLDCNPEWCDDEFIMEVIQEQWIALKFASKK